MNARTARIAFFKRFERGMIPAKSRQLLELRHDYQP